MPYPEMLVAPMRGELTSNGFTELKNAADVDAAFSHNEGTTLVVVTVFAAAPPVLPVPEL